MRGHERGVEGDGCAHIGSRTGVGACARSASECQRPVRAPETDVVVDPPRFTAFRQESDNFDIYALAFHVVAADGEAVIQLPDAGGDFNVERLVDADLT